MTDEEMLCDAPQVSVDIDSETPMISEPPDHGANEPPKAATRDEAIAHLTALADEVDAEHLIVALYAHLAGSSAKTRAEFDRDPSLIKIEFLGAYLYPGIGRSDVSLVTAAHVARGLCALDDIVRLGRNERFEADLAATVERDERESIAAFTALESTTVRGAAYPDQIAQQIAEIQGRYEAAFVRVVGIGPKRAVRALDAMVQESLARYARVMTRCREAGFAAEAAWRVRQPEQQTRQEQKRTDKIARFIKLLACENALNASAYDELPIARTHLPANVQLTEEEWRALIALIGLTAETRAAMVRPVDVAARPLYVLRDGRVLYAGSQSHMLDQLWVAFEEAATRSGGFPAAAYAKWKGDWLEEQAVSLFGRLFPDGALYRTLDYPNPDKPGGTTELDVAISWPPFLILVEAKAKAFHLKGSFDDTSHLRGDLKKNIAEAFDQARRAARYIDSVETARFTERGTGRELVVRKDEVQRTYLVTLSQHLLAGLASQAQALQAFGLFRHGEYPWALSVGDLEVVTRFSAGPDVLLHYVERRMAILRQGITMKGDELDLFGAYLDTRLRASWLEVRDGAPRAIALTGFQFPFDAAMMPDTTFRPEAKISLRVPPEIAAILNELRRRGDDKEARWIAFGLLDLPDDALGVLAAGLRDLHRQDIPPGIFRRSVRTVGEVVVVVVAASDQSPDELRKRTEMRVVLEKYRRKARIAIGFGIDRRTRGRPFDVACRLDHEWVHDAAIEQAIEDEPVPVHVVGKLPGRNAACICGSGRKFKHCCEPKYQAQRRAKFPSATPMQPRTTSDLGVQKAMKRAD